MLEAIFVECTCYKPAGALTQDDRETLVKEVTEDLMKVSITALRLVVIGSMLSEVLKVRDVPFQVIWHSRRSSKGIREWARPCILREMSCHAMLDYHSSMPQR